MLSKLEKFLILVTTCAVLAIFSDSLLKEYKFNAPATKQETKTIVIYEKATTDSSCAVYIKSIIEQYILGPSIVTFVANRNGIREDQVNTSMVMNVINAMERDCQQIVRGN